MMKLGLEFFRSKVAQRIFLLFISSALIPVAVLAIVHYKLVIREIYRKDQQQIHEISKSYLMDINQRLMLIREDMEMIASLYSSESLAVLQRLPEEFSDRFQKRLNGLVIDTDKGNRELLMGSSFDPPELNPVEEERIISRELLIKTEYHPENQSHIFMSIALNPEININPEAAIGAKNANNILINHLSSILIHQSIR